MAKTGRANLTRDPSVKALYEDLRGSHGEESHPRTAITRRMASALLTSVIPRRCKGLKFRARTRLQFAAELMLGLRVGEVVGGGDFHGLLANHLVIMRRLGADGEPTGDEVVEGLIEHSKTGFRRYVSALGLGHVKG